MTSIQICFFSLFSFLFFFIRFSPAPQSLTPQASQSPRGPCPPHVNPWPLPFATRYSITVTSQWHDSLRRLTIMARKSHHVTTLTQRNTTRLTIFFFFFF
jgi:hypothetical protein